MARKLQFDISICRAADSPYQRISVMSPKKFSADKMAIKFVEFDRDDNPVSENIVPLGLYLHEHEISDKEREMTAQLSAMVAKR